MTDDELWVHEHDWNCIPARSDFVVIKGYGKDAKDLVTFSEFDHGYDEAKRLAEQYIKDLRSA